MLPVPISTPGFDAAPYLTATLVHHARSEPASRTWGPIGRPLKATDRLAVRMVAREATGAGGYLHWLKYRKAGQKMPIAIVIGCAPVVMFTGPQKLARRSRRARRRGRARRRADPHGAMPSRSTSTCRPMSEIVIEGLIDTAVLEPEAPFGESNGYVALEAYNMPMQVTAITIKRAPVFPSIISQVTPSESSVGQEGRRTSRCSLSHLRDPWASKGMRRVVMHEPLTNLRPVIFVQFAARGAAHGGVARPAGRRHPAVELRQDRHRGERGHRPVEHGRGAVVARLSHQSDRGRAVMPNRGGVQGAQYGP